MASTPQDVDANYGTPWTADEIGKRLKLVFAEHFGTGRAV